MTAAAAPMEPQPPWPFPGLERTALFPGLAMPGALGLPTLGAQRSPAGQAKDRAAAPDCHGALAMADQGMSALAMATLGAPPPGAMAAPKFLLSSLFQNFYCACYYIRRAKKSF